MKKQTLPRWFYSVIAPSVISFLLVSARSEDHSDYCLEVTLNANAPAIAQLFFDTGHSTQEADSSSFLITAPDTPLTHRFRLPAGIYSQLRFQLRFDPLDRQGSVALSNIRILAPSFWGTERQEIEPVAAPQLRIANQISSLEQQGDSIRVITTKHANDPILLIQFDPPLALTTGIGKKAVDRGAAFIGVATLIWLMFSFAGRIHRRYADRMTTLTNRLSLRATSNPWSTIAGVAILAGLISTYPVAFLGKSFVSPNNGSPLLYDKYPTLPGYTSTSMEDVRGADIGAIMWAHVPYSAVESNALFQNSELPLWNRFNSTGVTLLGQGQSMFGDPLQIGVLLAHAASWAWDLKYIAAKILFALGAGFVVFATTRHLPTAVLLALSSVYIGFFAYRFNHPAIFSLAYAPWIMFFWVRFIQIPPKGSHP